MKLSLDLHLKIRVLDQLWLYLNVLLISYKLKDFSLTRLKQTLQQKKLRSEELNVKKKKYQIDFQQ